MRSECWSCSRHSSPTTPDCSASTRPPATAPPSSGTQMNAPWPPPSPSSLCEYGRMAGWGEGRGGGRGWGGYCLLVACLTSQQQASVSQGRICTDNFTCCHTEIEVADPTFYLTQSQYTDTGPTSPSADPITPGAWQDSHWSANF